jgi:hypothetical protein
MALIFNTIAGVCLGFEFIPRGDCRDMVEGAVQINYGGVFLDLFIVRLGVMI